MGGIETKENFKLYSAKIVYERWLITRGSKYRDLTIENFWCIFGKVVAEKRWLFMGGDRNRRFDCMQQIAKHFNAIYMWQHLLHTTCCKCWISGKNIQIMWLHITKKNITYLH